MNEIKIFENAEFGQNRTMQMPDGQIGFVGKDVATILGYKDTVNALKAHVDDDDKTGWQITTPSRGRQNITIINESGLYALVLSSKLQKAKEFKHWVTSVVLPQIRRTGGYISVSDSDDESTIMAKAFLIAKKTIEQKDAIIEAQRPKVIFAEAIVASDGDILIRDLAKLLTQNGIEIGQNRLFKWLRKNGFIFQNDTRPIQRYVEQGLFTTTVSLIETSNGSIERLTTKVTGKGQQYFINGFISGKFTL